MANLIAVLIQLIVYIQDGAARVTEDGVHALLFQTFYYRSVLLSTAYCSSFLVLTCTIFCCSHTSACYLQDWLLRFPEVYHGIAYLAR